MPQTPGVNSISKRAGRPQRNRPVRPYDDDPFEESFTTVTVVEGGADGAMWYWTPDGRMFTDPECRERAREAGGLPLRIVAER
jgi:hypothetical protein